MAGDGVSKVSCRAVETTGKILAFVLGEMKIPGGPPLPLPLCDALSQPLFISFIAPITFDDYFTSLCAGFESTLRMLTPFTNFIQQTFIKHLPDIRQCSKYWKHS